MRIVHVFPFLSISRGGGATWLISEICKAQAISNNVTPTFHGGSYRIDNKLVSELRNLGVIVKVNRSYLNRLNIHFMPGLFRDARELVRNNDIIHFHVLRSFQNIPIWLMAVLQQKPYVVDAHGSLPRHNPKKFLKKFIFDKMIGQFMISRASLFIAENELSVKECLEFGVPPEKIKIVRPPFPSKDFEDIRELSILQNTYGLEPTSKIILFFGRLHYIKGIDLIINAFSEALKTNQDLILVIMGPDEGELTKLQSQVSMLGLNGKVIFTGFKSGNEKLSIIKESHIVVQSSRYEQGAGAPFESVLCGTPILVSDNSGACLDVKRINAGFIFKFDDVQSFSEKVNHILNNYSSAKELTEKAAQRIKNELSFDNCLENYLSLYKDILSY